MPRLTHGIFMEDTMDMDMDYDKLTNNGATKIDEHSWMQYATKFFTSNDPNDP